MTSPAPSPTTAVRLIGDLTVQTAAETKARIMAVLDDGGDVDVDLSELTELDTAGLQILLLARREARHLGVGLILSGPPQPVQDVLRAVGLDANLEPASIKDESEPPSGTQEMAVSDVQR